MLAGYLYILSIKDKRIMIGMVHGEKNVKHFLFWGSYSNLRDKKIVRAPDVLTVMNGTAKEIVI